MKTLKIFVLLLTVIMTSTVLAGRFDRSNKGDSAKNTKSNTVKLEAAITKISTDLIRRLPAKSTIVVVNVSSDNRQWSLQVMDGLEYRLVGADKFIIVDRKRLDAIISEHRFQMTGLVSDSTVTKIGEMLGANIVITGEIAQSGANHRLSARALDVKTAQIIAMSRDNF